MLGSIIGDIIGSRFEFSSIRNKSEDFDLFTSDCTFTDDTVLSIATMDALLRNISFTEAYVRWGKRYNTSYGSSFSSWLSSTKHLPYGSFGNGSAMRVSPVGFFYKDLKDVLKVAKKSAIATHNHIDGVRGACAVAYCIYLARNNVSKKVIKDTVEAYFGYNLNRALVDIRPTYNFNETCQGSVPESIICFLESTSFEDAIRKVISLGGDTDTMACIVGGISEAYYTVPSNLCTQALLFLPEEMIDVIDKFYNVL